MAGRYQLAQRHKFVRRTSGNITLNSTNWANVDTGLDLTIQASADDVIEAGLSGFVGNEAVETYFDFATIVGGSPVNSFARAAAVEAAPTTTLGVSHWLSLSGVYVLLAGSIPYTVVSGDVSSGIVTVRFRYAQGAATNRTLRAGATSPLVVWARNIGPQDPH